MSNTILKKVEQYATDILKNNMSEDLTYHNYDHTKMVVDAATQIGKGEQLSDDDMEVLLIAAWFHDLGYKDSYLGHEEKSKVLSDTFLKNENVAAAKIEKIAACILSTHVDAVPSNQIEGILCDADMSHIYSGDYEMHALRLRQEWKNTQNVEHTDTEWTKSNLNFISRHQFHSAFAKKNYQKIKNKLRDSLEKQLNKLEKKMDKSMMSELGITAAEIKSLKKKLQKAEGRPERGIETMFRLTSKNHLDLSGMADSKANIMISVNSIIISILIGSLMQKLDTNPHLIIPVIILLTVNLASMIFSILSIRPNVTNGLFTREDIENQRTNLLFFGNFHKMTRDDYHWGMNQLMDNASFLYSSLIDDIYFLGVVLATKYRYLRISYNIFMYGIVVAVLAFVISNYFVLPVIEIPTPAPVK